MSVVGDDVVVAGPTLEHIAAVARIEEVGAGAAADHVVLGGVVAGGVHVAPEHVAALAAGQRVRSVAAEDLVVERSAREVAPRTFGAEVDAADPRPARMAHLAAAPGCRAPEAETARDTVALTARAEVPLRV